jgi:hypothetical protein
MDTDEAGEKQMLTAKTRRREAARRNEGKISPGRKGRNLKATANHQPSTIDYGRCPTAIDNAFGKREIWLVMKQPQRVAQKKLDYPEETAGSRLAAKARKLANKLTPERRREHFDGAMTMIYGGAKEATLPRR